jgi:hypothetical protein
MSKDFEGLSFRAGFYFTEIFYLIILKRVELSLIKF